MLIQINQSVRERKNVNAAVLVNSSYSFKNASDQQRNVRMKCLPNSCYPQKRTFITQAHEASAASGLYQSLPILTLDDLMKLNLITIAYTSLLPSQKHCLNF